MPQFLEPRLRAAAVKRGFTTPRQQARYVNGAMNRQGLMHGNQITPKGARMEAEHDAAENMRPRLKHPKRHLNLGKYLHPKGGY